MYDGNFDNDIEYTSPTGAENSSYSNNNMLNFFDVYIPALTDLEYNKKSTRQWHKIDYSITSETSELTDETGSTLMESFLNTVITKTPKYPVSYQNLIVSGIEFMSAGLSSWSMSTDITNEEYPQEGNSSWIGRNMDFPIGVAGMYATPKTAVEVADSGIGGIRVYTAARAIYPALLINKLGITKNFTTSVVKDVSTENRRIYIPILFIRKRAEIPTVSNLVTSYEKINRLDILMTPYNALELDDSTTTELSETKTYKGKTFNLYRAEVSAVKGASYYAKTEGQMSSLEAVRTVFREGFYVGAKIPKTGHTDVSTNKGSEFIIEIKRVYRDSSKIYVEYFMQSDASTIQSISEVPGFNRITDANDQAWLRDKTKGFIQSGTGSKREGVNIVTTGTSWINAYKIYEGSLWGTTSDKSKPATLTDSEVNSHRARVRDDATPSMSYVNQVKFADVIGESDNETSSDQIHPVKGTSTYINIPVAAEQEGAMTVVIFSYEWNPVSYETILKDTSNPFMKDLQKLFLPGTTGVLDSPGMSLQFNLIRP